MVGPDISFYVIINLCIVEPPRSGQSRPNSVRISEFHLVSLAKPGKRTVIGTYMAQVPFLKERRFVHSFGRMSVCFLLRLGEISK